MPLHQGHGHHVHGSTVYTAQGDATHVPKDPRAKRAGLRRQREVLKFSPRTPSRVELARPRGRPAGPRDRQADPRAWASLAEAAGAAGGLWPTSFPGPPAPLRGSEPPGCRFPERRSPKPRGPGQATASQAGAAQPCPPLPSPSRPALSPGQSVSLHMQLCPPAHAEAGLAPRGPEAALGPDRSWPAATVPAGPGSKSRGDPHQLWGCRLLLGHLPQATAPLRHQAPSPF